MFCSKCVMGCEVFEHSFAPRNDEVREKWRKALRLPSYQRSHRVCDKHFPKSAFLTFRRNRIALDAVPSLDIIAPKAYLKDLRVVSNVVVDPSKVLFTENHKLLDTAPSIDTEVVDAELVDDPSPTTTEASPLLDTEAEKLCEQIDPRTSDFFFQQTMYRIKDPRKSLPFYNRVLGMTLLLKLDFPASKFSLYFFGFEPQSAVPTEEKQRTLWAMSRKGTIQLTHNWGTENDPDYKYHTGNSEPRGFGHIGVMVPDVTAACERFEEMGVDFMKKPDDGNMKGLAFIKDPDGYWIQIFNARMVCQFAAQK